MKQVIGIWLCAILIGILGVFYVNWCIDSARNKSTATTAVREATTIEVCEAEKNGTWHAPMVTCEQAMINQYEDN